MRRKNYTLEEAGKHLGVSYRTMLRLVKKAALPFFRIGGQWRIKVSDLDRYIFEHKRRGHLGSCPIFFRMSVLNRYKKDPKYFIEEHQFYGKFGLKEEFRAEAVKDPDSLFYDNEVIHFQKAPLAGGVMAVCLDNEYYSRTIKKSLGEYDHWHSYRIHFPKLQRDGLQV